MNKSKFWVSLLSLVLLSACATQSKSVSRSDTRVALLTGYEITHEDVNPDYLQNIEPAAGREIPDEYVEPQSLASLNSYEPYTSAEALSNRNSHSCFNEKFDHQAIIAYQWGSNRVGFNINRDDKEHYEDKGAEEMKMTYRIKLQDIAKRDGKCSNVSSWQGILGSQFN